MSNIYLSIDWVFSTMMRIFNLWTQHFILSFILIVSVMSLVITLMLKIKGSK